MTDPGSYKLVAAPGPRDPLLVTNPRFYRDRTGRTVHLAGCKVRGERAPWHYADDKTDRQIAYLILNTPWLRPCRRCCGVLGDAL